MPFRFLDLPPELRLMVYERLPRYVKHHRIEGVEDGFTYRKKKQCSSIGTILVARYVNASILATCKEIYQESNPIVQKSIQYLILRSPPKNIRGAGASVDLIRCLMKILVVMYEEERTETKYYLRRTPEDHVYYPNYLVKDLRAEISCESSGRYKHAFKFVCQAAESLAHCHANDMETLVQVVTCTESMTRLGSLLTATDDGRHLFELKTLAEVNRDILDMMDVRLASAGFLTWMEWNKSRRGSVPVQLETFPWYSLVGVALPTLLDAMDEETWREEWLGSEAETQG